ncbi:MAG: VWA domain-containing protein [Planctomycetes bacterium]|nr:VWA domain-containing protein [Planctomycetota bacterium]
MSPLPQGLENPFLAPLLLAAFLPLLLHILDRRRARAVAWPAMRFLVPRSRGRLRRRLLREALLILVRSLAALLLAYAVLRPYALEEEAAEGRGAGSRGVVLAVDTSYSMSYREKPEGPSAFEAAKDAALQVLEETSPGDAVHVIAAGHRGPAPERPAPLDPDAARRAVRDLRRGGAPFRILEALDQASDLLPGLRSDRREVLLFTDLQASTLPDGSPERLRFAADRLRSPGPPPLVRIIDCGAPSPSNRFVSTLAPGPLAAGTDEPAHLEAAAEASGRDPGPMTLRLLVDGAEAAAAEPQARGGRLAHGFAQRFTAGGVARLSIALPPGDGLPEDDARHLALEVLERIEVLVLGRADAAASAARHVDLALAPRAPDGPAPAVIFRPELAPSLEPAMLEGKRVVVLAALERLGDAAAAALERFVEEGGGLLAFAGDEVAAPGVAEGLFRDGRGVLPARLAGRDSVPSGAEPLHPRDVATGHPALAVFADPEEGDLSRIGVRRWTRAEDLPRDAVVLGRLGPDLPWIVERPRGRGKAVLVATSASTDDSDLPRTPLFLPLLHRLARYLAAGDPAARTVLVGQPISARLPPGLTAAEPYAVDPRGERRPAAVEAAGGEPRAVFLETLFPGFYELRAGEGPGAMAEVFAANVPPEESRLERLGAPALADLRAALGVEVAPDPREATRTSVTRSVKREHWPAALAIALLLLFAEQVLARGFARGAEAARKPTPWR